MESKNNLLQIAICNSDYKIKKAKPGKYLVGKNGEKPELPFWVLDGVPIGKIRSGKFSND